MDDEEPTLLAALDALLAALASAGGLLLRHVVCRYRLALCDIGKGDAVNKQRFCRSCREHHDGAEGNRQAAIQTKQCDFDATREMEGIARLNAK